MEESWTWFTLKNGRCQSNARLDGKTAIITGSNSGLGLESAKDLYKRGCRVIMACRNIKAAEEAKTGVENLLKEEKDVGKLVVYQLDMASLNSIRQFADQVLQREPQINILINNAGLGGVPLSYTEDGFEMHFGVNYLGHYLLTMLLLPRLIKSAPARIVNVSSMLYCVGSTNFNDLQGTHGWWYSPLSCYGNSKLAQILFTRELAKRLEGTGVTVYALHPGVINTRVFRHVEKHNIYGPIIKFATKLFLKDVNEGAQTQIYCAVDEQAGKQSGLYYVDCRPCQPWSKAIDPQISNKLWQVSWEMTNLQNIDPFTPK